MICQNCSNWKCQKLTYDEVLGVWHKCIGGMITPGYEKRYAKMAQSEGIPFKEVAIGFKYCSAGIFSRLYLMRNESDCKPNRDIKECQSFRSENEGLQIEKFSPLWQLCISDIGGVTEVKGVTFAPGLYENRTYMRIPYYEEVRPKIEKREAECSSCGKKSRKSIFVRLEKSFCCNKHYLEWWAKGHRRAFKLLNKP
jgi:hypothetical protein